MKTREVDTEMSEIITGLYLSSLKAALYKDLLLKLGITHVISVIGDIDKIFPGVAQTLADLPSTLSTSSWT